MRACRSDILREMRRTLLAFLFLLAVLLPLKLWRASLGRTIWLDETYSLVVTTHTVPELVRLTVDDAHPPGYYLGLKVWLKIGRKLGLGPGILWARSLGILAWVIAAFVALVLGRRLLGPTGGTLFAWAVAASAAGAQMAQDARSYAFAFPALAICYILLVYLAAAPPPRWRVTAALWTAYVASAAFALWAHLLCGPVLACLASVWFGTVWIEWPRGHRRRRQLFAGLGAHALVILLFLPWLVHVLHQWYHLEATAPEWMTPATVPNLLLTFTYWLPFGRLGVPTLHPFVAWLPVGVATLALPALGLFLRRWIRRPCPSPTEPEQEDATRRASPGPGGPARPPRDRAALRAAILGLGSSTLFVTGLWLLARIGWAPVFHGPRYPLLAVGPWAGGLVGLALFSASHRPALGWLVISPWLLAGLVGQVWAGWLESRGGLGELLEQRGISKVYVMPSELIPYFRDLLAGLEVRPIGELPCDALSRPRAGSRAEVLDLDPWPVIAKPQERLAERLLDGGLLAQRVVGNQLDEHRTRAVLYELDDLRPEWCVSLCRHGFLPAPPSVPPAAPATALARDQEVGDGWGDLEIGPDLRFYRWGIAPQVAVRFSGSVGPGRFVLHVEGARQAFPTPVALLGGSLAHGAVRFSRALPAGPFHLEVPVTLDTGIRAPVLELHHPLWSPARVLGAEDPRDLSFQLFAAWFEPVGSLRREAASRPPSRQPQ